MEQALQVFKILGENDIYSQYADHYTNSKLDHNALLLKRGKRNTTLSIKNIHFF